MLSSITINVNLLKFLHYGVSVTIIPPPPPPKFKDCTKCKNETRSFAFL